MTLHRQNPADASRGAFHGAQLVLTYREERRVGRLKQCAGGERGARCSQLDHVEW